MDPERWGRIEELFLRAVELPPAERETWVELAAAGDADLASRVRAMIVHDERATGRLARPIGAAAAEARAAQDALRIGQRLGPYHLERELGRGGMGTVYLAARDDDQFRKRVAIKVATGALDSPEVLRRFRAEREILARLEHPNIARLLDAGTTAEGLPYVVMEYVEGRPIDRYCDERRLDTSERIALFRSVCAAVQHAHANLVVHRDLKPSNVLVTADGIPKLLDFGIAKLLDPDGATAPAAPTRTGLRLLTPGYASPEQVRGEPVTTASDVYSLGVLLYELLSGQPPYRLDAKRPSEVERVICEELPVRPSLVVGPARLVRALSGDLDTIVLTALRKEPARRYPSVERLDDDLRRHRAGLPVLARSDTWWYRTGKFVRRHTLETAAAGVLVVVVVGFGIGLAREARRTARERDTSERVTEFLVDLFQVPDPASGRGRDVTAREILDDAAARVEGELAQTPLVRARLMDAMGRAYVGLGLYDRARPILDDVIVLRRGTHATGDPRLSESLSVRAGLARSEGELDTAETLAREAVGLARETARLHPEVLVRALRSLGASLSAAGQLEEAESVLREAIALTRPLAEDDPGPLSVALQELGSVAEIRGDYATARTLLREALPLVEARYGRESTHMASAFGALGSIERMSGSYADAEPLLEDALAISRRVRGERHVMTAYALEELAKLRNDTGRGTKAVAGYREALAIHEEVHGATSFGTVVVKANLALALWEMDELDEAEALNRQVVAALRELVGERQPDTIAAMNNLAQVLHQKRSYDEAEATFVRVIELQRALADDDKPSLAYYLNNFGMLLRDMGQPGRAETMLREALELRRGTIGADHPLTAASMCNVAAALVDRGEFAEAEPLLREALAVERRKLPDGHASIASTLVDLGRLLVLTDRAAEAEPLLREAVGAYRSTTAAAPWRTAMSETVLAASLASQGRRDEATALARPALELLRREERLDRVSSVRSLLPR